MVFKLNFYDKRWLFALIVGTGILFSGTILYFDFVHIGSCSEINRPEGKFILTVKASEPSHVESIRIYSKPILTFCDDVISYRKISGHKKYLVTKKSACTNGVTRFALPPGQYSVVPIPPSPKDERDSAFENIFLDRDLQVEVNTIKVDTNSITIC